MVYPHGKITRFSLSSCGFVLWSEYKIVMKRMAELEAKLQTMNKPACMPPEKEEMLNAAISRADALEHELMATKKVYVFPCFAFINFLLYIILHLWSFLSGKYNSILQALEDSLAQQAELSAYVEKKKKKKKLVCFQIHESSAQFLWMLDWKYL